MTAILRVEAWDVHGRLSDLGVTEQALSDAVRRGYLAYSNCTANHPPLIPGIWAWGETVRALREYLLPLGWTRSDEDNYSLVINPSGEIAIAVATPLQQIRYQAGWNPEGCVRANRRFSHRFRWMGAAKARIEPRSLPGGSAEST